MSLWNPFSFDVQGRPATFAAPPALRMVGGPATAGQLAAAQAAFARFSAMARVSLVPNLAEAGSLPDGSAYRISVVGAQTIMQVWPVTARGSKKLGGILALYEGLGAFRVWWEAGSWRSEPIQRAFFGRGYQPIHAGGTHFTDLYPTYFYAEGPDNHGPTKLTGVETSGFRYGDKGLAIQSNGYLMESVSAGQSFGLAIANSAENFVFLNVIEGGFEIFATNAKLVPGDTPAVASTLVGAGEFSAQGFRSPSWPLARRSKDTFMIPALSVSAAPRLEVPPGFRNYVKFFDEPVAEVLITEIRCNPPYAVSSMRKPLVSDRFEEVYRESERLPEDLTQTGTFIYDTEVIQTSPDSKEYVHTGYPARARATTGVQYSEASKWTDVYSYTARESCWVRECVDFSGAKYSVGVRYEGAYKKQQEYRTVRMGLAVPTLYYSGGSYYGTIEVPARAIQPPGGPTIQIVPASVGIGQLQGATPSFRNEVDESTTMSNQVSTYLDLGNYSIPLTDIDLVCTTGKYIRNANPAAPGVRDEWGNVPPSISGKIVFRKVAAIEERNYLVVLFEATAKNLSVSYPESNFQNLSIRCNLESRLVLYHKGQKIFSEVIGLQSGSYRRNYTEAGQRPQLRDVGKHSFDVDLGRVALHFISRQPSGWVDEGGGGGHYTSIGIYEATTAPFISPSQASVSLYSAHQKIAGASSGVSVNSLEIIDYVRELDVGATSVVLSTDPGSGGCLVMAGQFKLLVSPGGSVTPISNVTGAPDASLQEMTACL